MDGWMEHPFPAGFRNVTNSTHWITSFLRPRARSRTPSKGRRQGGRAGPPRSREPSAAGARQHVTAASFCVITYTFTTLNQPEPQLKLPLPFFNHVKNCPRCHSCLIKYTKSAAGSQAPGRLQTSGLQVLPSPIRRNRSAVSKPCFPL